MKLKLLLLLLLFTTISKAQEVFTEVFQGNLPLSLITIEDELFVSVFSSNSEREAGVYKVPFDNPNNTTTITETTMQGLGPLYIAYNSDANILYGTTTDVIQVDLNEALPTSFESIVDNLNIGNNNGLIYYEGFVYFNVANDTIYRIATSEGANPELFFTIPESDQFVITQVINNELYYFKYNTTIGADLIKIDLSNPISETIVSTVDNFDSFAQSSYVVNNTLFVGLETNSSSPSIIKYDLTQSIPITGEPITETTSIGSVLGITSYQNDLFFSDGSSQNISRLEDGVLNVSGFETLDISIFPNPTSDKLFIKDQNNSQIDYQVINILGKIISKGLYTSEGIDFSSYGKGVYFVKLSDTNGNLFTKKVVKK